MGGLFDTEGAKKRILEIEEITSQSGFWDDNLEAEKILKERSALSSKIKKFEDALSLVGDAKALVELFEEDSSLESEALAEVKRVTKVIEDLELAKMLSSKNDHLNAIIEINSGAGGTEAQDWCEMLLRMYLRWAEKNNYKTSIISLNSGEEAGIKNVTLLAEGENAFGYLRSERGVHRLVRISPFDSNSRRHTSFASVGVVPEVNDDIEIEVREEDLRIDTYRASGAGGQHINKTDSAVRLTHIPTSIVVTCQNDRSQHKNKAQAMKVLKAKLYELEMEKKRAEIEKIAGERKKIDFGSQIRSYVMHPYQMVKDLRTKEESSNVQAVLDGEIDKFIRAYLLSEEYNTE